MKLITEFNDRLKFLTENKNGTKQYYIEGIFIQTDKKNQNGRIYPKAMMKSAVKKYVDEQVLTGRAVGELNHPESPSINLDKVSHRILSLDWSGNNVIGKALILDTPMGKIVKGLMDGGVQLGVSTRGIGSVYQDGDADIVGDDFILNTVDIVQDPSAPEAFVNGIMEGKEWNVRDGNICESSVVSRPRKETRKPRTKSTRRVSHLAEKRKRMRVAAARTALQLESLNKLFK